MICRFPTVLLRHCLVLTSSFILHLPHMYNSAKVFFQRLLLLNLSVWIFLNQFCVVSVCVMHAQSLSDLLAPSLICINLRLFLILPVYIIQQSSHYSWCAYFTVQYLSSLTIVFLLQWYVLSSVTFQALYVIFLRNGGNSGAQGVSSR